MRLCIYIFCMEDNINTRSKWWRDYGACSRACAEEHYGPEALR